MIKKINDDRIKSWQIKKSFFKRIKHDNMIYLIDILIKKELHKEFYASNSHYSLLIGMDNVSPSNYDKVAIEARKEGARHYANIKNDYRFEYEQKPYPRKTIKIKECSKEEVENVLIEFLEMLRDSEKE